MGLVHHSERGSQYQSIKYTTWLAEAGIESPVGSAGDSYGNAPAEPISGHVKAGDNPWHGPWRSLKGVGYARLEGVGRFNNRRFLEPIGKIVSAGAEAIFYEDLDTEPVSAGLTKTSLRQTRCDPIRIQPFKKIRFTRYIS